MRYYWCVNCGHEEDLGRAYKRKQKCSKCDYEDLTELSQEEFEEKKGKEDGQIQDFTQTTEERSL